MDLLAAVNLIMPKLGERPLTSLTVKHPTLGVLLPIIDTIRQRVLNRGWWFNEYRYTGYPNLAGEIELGADVLSFLPDNPGEAVLRGQVLFNPATMTSVFTKPVTGVVRQDLKFDALPQTAQMHVLYSACVEVFATDIGLTSELQVWQGQAQSTWSDLIAEHMRQRRYNTRQRREWRKIREAMRS